MTYFLITLYVIVGFALASIGKRYDKNDEMNKANFWLFAALWLPIEIFIALYNVCRLVSFAFDSYFNWLNSIGLKGKTND